LSHSNVLKLIDVQLYPGNLWIVFEFVDTDLRQVIDNSHRKLDSMTIKALLYQLLHGLAYCHRKRVIHRDLKPQNILIGTTHGGVLKIADFGLSRPCGGYNAMFAHDVVTLWYRAPELLLGSRHYTVAIDIWSAGCIFAELVNGVPLFASADDYAQLKAIFSVMGTPDASKVLFLDRLQSAVKVPQYSALPLSQICPRLDAVGIDLLRRMLEYDPQKRISAEEALSHDFFSDLRSEIQSSNKSR
jgi:cyclin-dependent kinase